MEIPKYQWLIPEQEHPCGFCDKLYISNTFTPAFQVRFDPTTIFDEDFDDATADPVNDNDTYIFDMSYSPAGQAWINSFTFTVNGEERCYIFVKTTDNLPLTGRATEYGLFTLVEVDDTISLKVAYAATLNVRLFDAGVTATVNGNNIEITGLPVDAQVIDTPNFPTVSGSAGTSSWGYNNFFPVGNKACFFNVSCYDETPGYCTSTPSVFKQVVLTAGNKLIVTVNFTNSFGYDVDLSFYVRDSGFNEIDVQTSVAEPGTNTLTFCYDIPDPSDSSYYLEFLVNDAAAYDNSIITETTGFCFNTIKAETIARVDKVEATDCNDVTTELTIAQSDSCGYNYLVTINDTLPTTFMLTVTGTDSDTVTSLPYEVIDPATCRKGKLYRLRWYDDCQFADIDYANLSFTNELYLTGSLVKTGLERVEALANITSSGNKIQVYRHTIGAYEFRAHPYSAAVHESLERAFEHSHLLIDNDRYYIGDNEGFVVSEIGDHIYTGRVDLLKDGTEVISSSCCC